MPQYKYKVKKGTKWFAKFNYTDPNTGIIHTEYKRGFDSKRDAKEYEEEFLTELETPPDLVNEGSQEKTFGEVFSEYLASHKHADIKENSLDTKLNVFKTHIFPTFKNTNIADITANDIANWQKRLKQYVRPNGKPYSESYLRTIQSQFNSIINYADDKGYLKQNPLADIKNMGIKGKRVEFWSVEEYEKFAYEAMNYPEFYYAFEVLYWCGLREGEMLALTLSDIDFNNCTISVTKTYQRLNGKDIISSPKTVSSVRIVSIPIFLRDELQEYVNMLYNPTSELRIFQISKHALSKHFHAITAKAGLKRITIHGLRHSHVSLLINKKYDIFEVSKRVGHKSIKTTQDIYGHLFDSVQKTIANDLDSLRRR